MVNFESGDISSTWPQSELERQDAAAPVESSSTPEPAPSTPSPSNRPDDCIDDETQLCRRGEAGSEVPDLGFSHHPASGKVETNVFLTERFAIRRRLGVGGNGTVFLAYDSVLQRDVALKLPRVPKSAGTQIEKRLLTEARANARLSHPHIVPILDVGMCDEYFYITSIFVDGPTLKQWLVDSTIPMTPKTACHIVRQLADAIQHAHDHKILHRDLKPGNVLVDLEHPSRGLPFTTRLTDFGLAKILDADFETTREGDIVGTLSYMAPEQAQGDVAAVGPAVDIYALGAILYELLTGKVPIHGSNAPDLICRIVSDTPVSPRLINPSVPRDVDAVCMKCLEKSPEQRYSSSGELAEDLQRCLDGRPVQARPSTFPGHLWRLAKRNPVISVLAGLLVFAVVSHSLFLAWHAQTVERINQKLRTTNAHLGVTNERLAVAMAEAQVAARRAEKEEHLAKQTVYAYDIRRAFEAWQENDIHEMKLVVDRYADGTSVAKHRGIEWQWLQRQVYRDGREVTQVPGAVYRMALAPDGNSLAFVGADALVRVIDLASGQLLKEWPTQQEETNGLAFSLDGQTLWTTGDDGTLRAWNVATHKELWRIDAHPGHLAYEVVFAPRHGWLITCGNEPTIRIWDAKTGASQGTLTGHTESVDIIRLHPDGKRLFSGATDDAVRFWDLDSLTCVRTIQDSRGNINGLAVSSSGRLLAACTAMGCVHLWELEQDQSLGIWQMPNEIERMAFDSGEERLFLADKIGYLHVITLPKAGAPFPDQPSIRDAWQMHQRQVYDMQFLPGRNELLSAGRDGRVLIWKSSRPASDCCTIPVRNAFFDFTCVPGKPLIVTAGDQGLELIDFETEPYARQVLDDSAAWEHVTVSADGEFVAATNRSEGPNRLGVWCVSDGRRLVDKSSDRGSNFNVLSFSADCQHLATCMYGGNTVFILDTQSGRNEQLIPVDRGQFVQFSPDGHWLILDSYCEGSDSKREIRVLNWPEGTIHTTIPTGTAQIALAPNSRLIAFAELRVIRVHDVRTGEKLCELSGHRYRVNGICFSPDSRTLVSSGEDGVAKLWHVPTGQFLMEFSTEDGRCSGECHFTSDGRYLVFSEDVSALRVVRF